MTEIVPSYQDSIINSYEDMTNIAKAMVQSGFFQDTKSLSQAIVKITAGREIGIGAFASMSGVNIIQGKPSFGANIMASKVKASGRYSYRVTEMSETNCSIEFLEHFDGRWTTIGISSFSIQDAKKAGTKNLDKFPRNMLFARAMSNGVRWYCPDVMNGATVYTPEELGASVDDDGNVIDADVVEIPIEPEPKPEVVDAEVSADPMTIEDACKVETSDDPPKRYGDLTMTELVARFNELNKQLKDNHLEPSERAIKERKMNAAKMVIDAKRNKEI